MTNTSYNISYTVPVKGTPSVLPYLTPIIEALKNEPLLLWIHRVCGTTTTAATPGIATSPQQPDFRLDFVKLDFGHNRIAVKVTVAPDRLFSADRPALRDAFAVFRHQVEALEHSGALIPGGSDIVLRGTTDGLPLRYDDILFFHYGFDRQKQCVDLHAGMTVRLDFAAYQYVGGPDAEGFGLNGYVGGGSQALALVRQPDLTLSLSAFHGAMAGTTLHPPPSCPLVAGSVADLMLKANARRRMRLLYPRVLNGARTITTVGNSHQDGVMLLAADTWADLDAATTACLANISPCGRGAATRNPVVCVTFNGRTTAVPEIIVMVGGRRWSVPLGTTVRDLITQEMDPPPWEIGHIPLQIQRWAQRVDKAPMDAGFVAYGRQEIDLSQAFNAARAGSPGAEAAWDLPLIKGDAVAWRPPRALV